MFVEHRREVERLDHLLDLYLRCVALRRNLRRTVMQLHHNARKPLLPERHQHPPPDHRLHARRNGIGKRHVKRHGKRDVAEEGHVWELIKSYRIPK